MKRVAVLGTGLVGSLVARDLAADPGLSVTAWDASEAALSRLAKTRGIETRVADLSDAAATRKAAEGADVVAVAVPGFLGLGVLREAISVGRPIVDISFSPEDPFVLDAAAKRAGVPVVVDCGVAPGISNLLAGRAVSDLDRAERLRILVGGLPSRRVRPWEYRLVFSLTDVLEEYTRPARYRENGQEVVRPALSDVEPVDIPGIGTLEAFLTDGSRTLLSTLDVPNLVEKTLRWPGHAERIRILRETGFLDGSPVDTEDGPVTPRALTEALLARAWALPPGDEEFTVLRVEAEGVRRGRKVRLVDDLVDRTDRETGATSMARTTGFPCAIVARLLADGAWSRPGVAPPEFLGREDAVSDRILADLASRGVRIDRREDDLGAA